MSDIGMGDIVDQLEAMQIAYENKALPSTARLYGAAKDEIKRLRAGIELNNAANDRQAAEIERLRDEANGLSRSLNAAVEELDTIRAATIEECAQIADKMAEWYFDHGEQLVHNALELCAGRIRALANPITNLPDGATFTVRDPAAIRALKEQK